MGLFAVNRELRGELRHFHADAVKDGLILRGLKHVDDEVGGQARLVFPEAP